MKIEDFLSNKGKRISFPEKCILNQAEQQQTMKINASMGISAIDGQVCYLPSITQFFNAEPHEVVKFSPLCGFHELRNLYKERIIKQNNLFQYHISLPIITNGITHALALARDLFFDPGECLIVHDMYWENYDLMFQEIGEVVIKKYNMFQNDLFDIDSLKKCLLKNLSNKKISLLFNFPNNPTGYTPSQEMANQIADLIYEIAEQNRINFLVLIDEAGYGFFYDDFICQESLFSLLLKRKSNYIIPVLAKGSTKEDLSYGLRVASITFGVNTEISKTLEGKCAGFIRGNLSTVASPTQIACINGIKSASRNSEFLFICNTLKERYNIIFNDIIPSLILKGFNKYFYLYPCNSGFFVTLKLLMYDSDFFQKSLNSYNIGINILDKNHIRVCFSSVNKEDLRYLFDTLFAIAINGK